VTVQMAGFGRPGTGTDGWEYDYYAWPAYMWPAGVNQVPSLWGRCFGPSHITVERQG
jgi:hypothetical protein